MPYILFTTNVQQPDERALIVQLGEVSSRLLGRPTSTFMLQYKYDPNLAFGGTFEPAWIMQVYGVGMIGVEANKGFAKGYWEWTNSLGLPADRGYITFFDVGYENWAWQGNTITHLDPARQGQESERSS